jgi:hypothetical protein
MSADGIILDYRKPVVFKIYCYGCGADLDPSDPSKGHEKSLSDCTADGYGDRALRFGWSQEAANFEV